MTTSAGRSVTGPSRPEGSRVLSLVQWCQVVNVRRPVGLGLPASSQDGQAFNSRPFHSQSGGSCSSPIRRLGHKLVTLTRSVFLPGRAAAVMRSEEHTSELQSRQYLVCRLLL